MYRLTAAVLLLALGLLVCEGGKRTIVFFHFNSPSEVKVSFKLVSIHCCSFMQ